MRAHARGVSLGERSLLVAVKNIARRLGDDISEAKPILDSRLPDGSRVAAVIPPCSLRGVTLTIRKFNVRHFEVADLITTGTLTHALANRFEDYILQRRNLLICGGTGTGKTTLLNALGKFIPPDERIPLSPFVTSSKPRYGTGPIVFCWEKLEEARPSTCFNS